MREYLDALDAAAPPAPDEPCHGAPKYPSATDPAAAWSNKHGMADTDTYEDSCRRRLKVEVLFAHLKQQLWIRRLRLRGLKGAAEEFHLAAAVQNLKRLAGFTARGMMGQIERAASG